MMASRGDPMSRRWMMSRIPILVAPFLMLSCSSRVYRDLPPAPVDGRYDSEFPSRRSSKQLEDISESVKMITAIAYYRTFSFTPEEHVQKTSIAPEYLEAHEEGSV